MRSTISKFAVTAGVAAAALALTGGSANAGASAGGHAAEPDVIRLDEAPDDEPAEYDRL